MSGSPMPSEMTSIPCACLTATFLRSISANRYGGRLAMRLAVLTIVASSPRSSDRTVPGRGHRSRAPDASAVRRANHHRARGQSSSGIASTPANTSSAGPVMATWPRPSQAITKVAPGQLDRRLARRARPRQRRRRRPSRTRRYRMPASPRRRAPRRAARMRSRVDELRELDVRLAAGRPRASSMAGPSVSTGASSTSSTQTTACGLPIDTHVTRTVPAGVSSGACRTGLCPRGSSGSRRAQSGAAHVHARQGDGAVGAAQHLDPLDPRRASRSRPRRPARGRGRRRTSRTRGRRCRTSPRRSRRRCSSACRSRLPGSVAGRTRMSPSAPIPKCRSQSRRTASSSKSQTPRSDRRRR